MKTNLYLYVKSFFALQAYLICSSDCKKLINQDIERNVKWNTKLLIKIRYIV